MESAHQDRDAWLRKNTGSIAARRLNRYACTSSGTIAVISTTNCTMYARPKGAPPAESCVRMESTFARITRGTCRRMRTRTILSAADVFFLYQENEKVREAAPKKKYARVASCESCDCLHRFVLLLRRLKTSAQACKRYKDLHDR